MESKDEEEFLTEEVTLEGREGIGNGNERLKDLLRLTSWVGIIMQLPPKVGLLAILRFYFCV